MIYSGIASLDSFIADTDGAFGWGASAQAAGLVYEGHLFVAPVLVGDGTRYFPRYRTG